MASSKNTTLLIAGRMITAAWPLFPVIWVLLISMWMQPKSGRGFRGAFFLRCLKVWDECHIGSQEDHAKCILMKLKQIFISILAVLFVFPLMGTFAQQAPDSVSIRVLTTFDYPGTVISTQPQNINDGDAIVGIYVDSLGVQRGFVRFSNGNFSAPIVEPNDTGNL